MERFVGSLSALLETLVDMLIDMAKDKQLVGVVRIADTALERLTLSLVCRKSSIVSRPCISLCCPTLLC